MKVVISESDNVPCKRDSSSLLRQAEMVRMLTFPVIAIETFSFPCPPSAWISYRLKKDVSNEHNPKADRDELIEDSLS